MGIFTRSGLRDEQSYSREEIKYYVSGYNQMKQERNDMESERDLALERLQKALDDASRVQTLESDVLKYKAAYENAQNRANEANRELSEATRANEILTSRLEKSENDLKSALQYQESLKACIEEMRSQGLATLEKLKNEDIDGSVVEDIAEEEYIPPVIEEVKPDADSDEPTKSSMSIVVAGTEGGSSGNAQSKNRDITVENLIQFEKENGIGEAEEKVPVRNAEDTVVETTDERSRKPTSEVAEHETQGTDADVTAIGVSYINANASRYEDFKKMNSDDIVPEVSTYTDSLKSEDEDIPVIQPPETRKLTALEEIERLTQTLSDMQTEGGIYLGRGTVEDDENAC